MANLYRPLDFVVVRAPAEPVERYLALDATRPTGPPGGRAAAAIAVASPSLAGALGRGSRDPRDAARRDGALLRYLIRMATRPTPFGLFAGVGLAGWGDTTDLHLADRPPRTRTRPDMGWLLDLVAACEARPAARRELRLVADPTALVGGGRVALPERGLSVRATGAVCRVLAAARRPVPAADLAALLLATTPGATPDRVGRLLDELWRVGLLATDLRPPLTAGDPAAHVADRLAGVPALAAEAARLAGARRAAAALDHAGVDAGWAARFVAAGAASAGGPSAQAPAAGAAPRFQVDMALPLEGRVGRAVGREAARAAELLLWLSPAPVGPGRLAAYRRAFLARYGADREVPVVELVDHDAGLGPLDAVPDHGAGRRAPGRAQALLDLACAALREHRTEVELTAAVLRRLAGEPPDPAAVPATLDLYVSVAARAAAAVDAGDFLLVVGPGVGAPGAGRSLGRFADLLGRAAVGALERAAAAEAARRPGPLHAELVWLPRRGRSANVAVRPGVHPYEVVVGAAAGVPADRVIPLDELVCGMRDGRLVVRWPAAGRELALTAGHLLNSRQAPPAGRLLAEIGGDGRPQLGGFDWGPAAGFPYLPRVRAGRVVLRPAQWRLDPAAVPADPPERFADALAAWRAAWRVPRHVCLAAGDNRLLLDLDAPPQAAEVRRELAGRAGPLVLQEALPGPEHAWLPGPGGRHAAELVIPLAVSVPRPEPATAPTRAAATPGAGQPGPATSPHDARPGRARAPVAAAERWRPPGSDWLYAKLYVAPVATDELLAGEVARFAGDACRRGLAAGWHFLRYADPEPHLRLRFKGDPGRLTGELLPDLLTWAGGHCRRLAVDTYERELERYGGPAGLAAAEEVSAADSRAVVALLRLDLDGALPFDRTALAVLAADDLLAGLGLGQAERLAWCRGRRTGRPESGPAWRARKGELRMLLADPAAAGPAREVLAERRASLAGTADRLAGLAASGALGQPADRLWASLLHLHANRLLGRDRAAERLLLGLLARAREALDRAPLP